MTPYEEFLASKCQLDPATGLLDIPDLPAQLFRFQRDITRWALLRGRAAVFAQTGLGKSFIELAWGQAIHTATGGDVLLLTPLAVAGQMVGEAAKFGLAAKQCAHQGEVEPGVTVTNYAKLHHFDLSRFAGVILDESSILKAFDGKTRTTLIQRCADVPYRLACTATPAPNDFNELGNHAEFLGVMSVTGMQAKFFTHDAADTTAKWRLKGHAEAEFWRWMCSWSVLLRRPSDLGYEDGEYELPPLKQVAHVIAVEGPAAKTLSERLRARRASIDVRVKKAVEIIRGDLWIEKSTCASGSKRTASTSENIVMPLPTGETQRAVLSTPSTPSIANGLKPPPDPETNSPAWTEDCGQPSGSAKPTISPCSTLKAAVAQSAELSTLTGEGTDSTLTTTTLPERFEGCSAATAISESESSATIPQCLVERSNTSLIQKPWVVWCNLNDEQDRVANALGGDCISIYGSLPDGEKEKRLAAWLRGDAPVLVSKPSIFGFGMNFQRCSDTLFVGLNDSFEQVYQATRRFWRFGQQRPVTVHFVAASTEGAVLDNLRRKEAEAERMGDAMVEHMADISSELIHGAARETDVYEPTLPVLIPGWLHEEEECTI